MGKLVSNWILTVVPLILCGPQASFGAERNQSPANPPGSTSTAGLKLADFHLLHGNFVQTKFFKEMDVKIETKGKFRIAKPMTAESTTTKPQAEPITTKPITPGPSTIHWDIEQPQPAHICIDGTGIVVGGGVGSAPASQKKLSFSEVSAETGNQISGLMKLMTMDSAQINTEFKVTPKASAFVLTPKNPVTAFFASAEVELNYEGFASKVLIQEKTGDELNLQFSQLKTGEPTAADQGCGH